MALTGKERSLTIKVNKTLAGVQSEGYPRTYYGRNEFTYNSIVYPAIDTTLLATMPLVNFNARLVAFKSYVEGIETGLDIDETTIAGSEAYRDSSGFVE